MENQLEWKDFRVQGNAVQWAKVYMRTHARFLFALAWSMAVLGFLAFENGIISAGIGLSAVSVWLGFGLHRSRAQWVQHGAACELDAIQIVHVLVLGLDVGLAFEEVLERASQRDSALGKEFKQAVMEIQHQGKSVQSALIDLSMRCDSSEIKRIVQQLVCVYEQEGSQGLRSEPLRKLANDFVLREKNKMRERTQKQAFSGLFVIVVSGVLPALFLSFVGMGAYVLDIGLTPLELLVITWLGFPSANALVIGYVNAQNPKTEWKKETISNEKINTWKERVQEVTGKPVKEWVYRAGMRSMAIGFVGLVILYYYWNEWTALGVSLLGVIILGIVQWEWANYQWNVCRVKMEKEAIDFLWEASLFPRHTPVEKLIKQWSARENNLGNEFKRVNAELKKGKNVLPALEDMKERVRGKNVHALVDLLQLQYQSNMDMSPTFQWEAQSLMELNSIQEEGKSIQFMQKTSILFSAAVLVPLIVGLSLQGISGLQNANIEFLGTSVSVAQRELQETIEMAGIGYMGVNALLAGYYWAVIEQKKSRSMVNGLVLLGIAGSIYWIVRAQG